MTRTGQILAGVMLCAAGSAAAVTPSQVATYARLDTAFTQRLGKSLAADDAKARAQCMLAEFDAAGGARAVNELLGLMTVLSGPSQFDDPQIVAFNAEYGPLYARALSGCGAG